MTPYGILCLERYYCIYVHTVASIFIPIVNFTVTIGLNCLTDNVYCSTTELSKYRDKMSDMLTQRKKYFSFTNEHYGSKFFI